MKTLLITLLTSCAMYAQSYDIAQAVFYFNIDTLTTSQLERIAQLDAAQVTVYSDSTHMEARATAAQDATGIKCVRVYAEERKVSILWFRKEEPNQ
mgnify:CR=1 FL=1